VTELLSLPVDGWPVEPEEYVQPYRGHGSLRHFPRSTVAEHG
jgi:hypothetical protein